MITYVHSAEFCKMNKDLHCNQYGSYKMEYDS